MRRTHLRVHENILKRLLVHVAGFNLSLVMRQVLGVGTARGLQGFAGRVLDALNNLCRELQTLIQVSGLLHSAPNRSNALMLAAA